MAVIKNNVDTYKTDVAFDRIKRKFTFVYEIRSVYYRDCKKAVSE